MIKSVNILTIADYVPKAEDAIDDPNLLGRETARLCTETVVAELIERGYTRPAIIDGLARALSNVVSETYSSGD